ncbi:MAG: metallophosphoesterase [Streptococcaceae bacterium]|jgi:hypothetical protein|nr:metallophosphoesterase [Streptococcaceae bacterium]
MKKKILKQFIVISSLIFTLIFITINVQAQVTDEECIFLENVINKLEQHAQKLKPSYKDPKRSYEKVLTKDEILYVLNVFNRERAGQSMLTELTMPQEGAVSTSDWHGDLLGLTETAQAARKLKKLYVITGDVVDRGRESVECAVYALASQARYPDHFVYIAGDHEVEEETNSYYGLKEEVRRKYGEPKNGRYEYSGIETEIYNTLNHSFRHLPLVALVDGKIFFVHGGFGETTDLDKLRNLTAPSNSWIHREVVLDDEKCLNQKDKVVLQNLRNNYNWQYDLERRLGWSKETCTSCTLKYLDAILNPQKMVTELTWSDFHNDSSLSQYKKFPTNSKRGSVNLGNFSKILTCFVPDSFREFCENNNLKAIVRGHEHTHYNCGARVLQFDGKQLVTTTSSKNVYLFQEKGTFLPKGDVVLIDKDLNISSKDTEQCVIDFKLEDLHNKGQANCATLLAQTNALFRDHHELELSLAEQAKSSGNAREALKHYVEAQTTASQAVAVQFTALSEKHAVQDPSESESCLTKAKQANEIEKIFRDIDELRLQEQQTRDELDATNKKRFIRRAGLRFRAKKSVKKIKDKLRLTANFVSSNNADFLSEEGMDTYDMVESSNKIQELLKNWK